MANKFCSTRNSINNPYKIINEKYQNRNEDSKKEDVYECPIEIEYCLFT